MKFIRITLISLFVFYLVYYFHNSELINNDRAKKQLRNGFDYIIDVRSEQEYNDGHNTQVHIFHTIKSMNIH